MLLLSFIASHPVATTSRSGWITIDRANKENHSSAEERERRERERERSDVKIGCVLLILKSKNSKKYLFTNLFIIFIKKIF